LIREQPGDNVVRLEATADHRIFFGDPSCFGDTVCAKYDQSTESSEEWSGENELAPTIQIRQVRRVLAYDFRSQRLTWYHVQKQQLVGTIVGH
jgi:hypothetical protein